MRLRPPLGGLWLERGLIPKLAIGIDVGGTFIKAGLVNRRGEIVARGREMTQEPGRQNQVISKIVATIRDLEKRMEPRGEIAGVGLGVAGLIHPEEGRILTSPNIPGWRDFPLLKYLQKEIRYPVFLENDANAAALGEKWIGAARGISTFCLLTLGTGVGGGLILEGEVWHGANGTAGEFGHMTIDPDGPWCSCGNRGCLEAYASVTALRRNIREAIASGRKTSLSMNRENGPLNGEMIYRAAQKGDALAREEFERMGAALGIGITNLIHLLSPQSVILGGGLSAAWKFFFPALRENVRQRAIPASARGVQIIRASTGEDAGILGATYLVWRRLGLIP